MAVKLPGAMTSTADTFPCPRCGERLPTGYARCDACGAYVVSVPDATPSSAVKREPVPAGGTPAIAWLLLVVGLLCGGAVGYALRGAVGPRSDGGMPTGPADILGGMTGGGEGGAMGGGGMGGGASGTAPATPQMPPQVTAMVQQYRQTLARDSGNVEANIGFGNLLFDSGQWQRAVEHYQRALDKTPGNADVRVDMAIALHNLGQNEQAKKEMERVTREQPTHLNAWLNLGVVAATIDDRAGAIRAWEQYLKLAPKSEHAAAIRAQIEDLKKGS
jgi:hypothetical protein